MFSLKTRLNKITLGVLLVFLVAGSCIISVSSVSAADPVISTLGTMSSYSTKFLSVTGSVYDAKILPNGNMLYAVARSSSSKMGAAECNPAMTQILWSYRNTSWNSGNGPEQISKLSNGNYLIADCDASDNNYEMSPTNSKIWNYVMYSAESNLVKINGVDSIILSGFNKIRIINYSNRTIKWEMTSSSFNYINAADFTTINGVNYIWAADCYAKSLFLINYDTKTIEKTVPTGVSAGPYDVRIWRDNMILVAEGSSRLVTIRSQLDGHIIWTSPTFDSTTIGASISPINQNTFVISDNTPIIKSITVSYSSSTPPPPPPPPTTPTQNLIIGQSFTDVNGQYTYSGLLSGSYVMSIRKPNYVFYLYIVSGVSTIMLEGTTWTIAEIDQSHIKLTTTQPVL